MVQLVSIDFIKLVAIAAVFAWPMAYFGISRWLAAFTYRIDIGPWTFLLAAALASILIALATLSYHAIRAALANPVQTLRYE